ncbi:hypothetical protein DUNSADRAFT_12737 [Dunaliella salina]|uniref:Uncharacterized protein n=1 Tax=Dunaliella salina TaxID=3046 RepID=A0ABQ7GAV4_DUNSA|nr:hypothetical protein DUNSADRAFT_12737 [Dunaliella salina]|eukprot:KAF5831683.1 hypothetical protein DUNSADRAFT_12737 [Dunaliella salina]
MGNEKTALKEGGKKGQDLSGMAQMGGVTFFNVSAEEPNGDWKLLEKVMEGANAPVDETAEERKGGAGIRDEAITAGFQLFKAKGLVPANADSDSDDVNYAEAAGVEW